MNLRFRILKKIQKKEWKIILNEDNRPLILDNKDLKQINILQIL